MSTGSNTSNHTWRLVYLTSKLSLGPAATGVLHLPVAAVECDCGWQSATFADTDSGRATAIEEWCGRHVSSLSSPC